MKHLIIIVTAFFFLLSCKNEADKQQSQSKDSSHANHPASEQNAEVKEVTPSFTNLDAKATAYIKSITHNYLKVKNGLANDDAREAANGAEQLAKALADVDKSVFTPDQKKAFDDYTSELQEHAGHIAKKSGDIDHQRDHFTMLSEDVAALVKAFGGGRTLYQDFCPMAKDNKGAIWVSETKDIKNPYFGSKMLECGEVQEMIK